MKIFRQNLKKVLSKSKMLEKVFFTLEQVFQRVFFWTPRMQFWQIYLKDFSKRLQFFLRESKIVQILQSESESVRISNNLFRKKNVSSKKSSRLKECKVVIPDENFSNRAIGNVVWNPKRLKNIKFYFQKNFSWKCSSRPVDWKLDNLVEFFRRQISLKIHNIGTIASFFWFSLWKCFSGRLKRSSNILWETFCQKAANLSPNVQKGRKNCCFPERFSSSK